MQARQNSVQEDLDAAADKILAYYSSSGATSRASRATSVDASDEEPELEPEPEERPRGLLHQFLISYCSETPGLFLFIPFSLSLVAVWALSHQLTGFIPVKQQDEMTMVVQQTKFIEVLAAGIFAISIVVQSSGVLFQVTKKKRFLNSFVVYINLAACTAYVVSALDVFPHFVNLDGEDTEFFRLFAWCNTTPMMILVIASLGGSGTDSVVPSWSLVFHAWAWDYAMLLLGMVQMYFGRSPLGYFSAAASTFCMLRLFGKIATMTDMSIANAATSMEIQSLRGVQYLTYLFWSAFPVVAMLKKFQFIDHFQYEVAAVAVDTITKNVYSVVLLSGNFCILDMVATIRMAQLKTEEGKYRSAVVNVEAVNKALQTAVVEAEASSRLSRQFLANISHELRTPLNSVIAFSSLLLEAEDISPPLQDYVRSSVTSAEALLSIINQVLEYAKLETEEQEKLKNPESALVSSLQLANMPFSLAGICAELSDQLATRAKECGVDFIISFDEIWSPTSSKSWFMGDASRIRQESLDAMLDLAWNS